ncbi:MAG: hypothetical protein MJD61_09345 [Proteobacteria bacterium]|nr:hypothetical protein [Pseudomonadota bacterium]
MSVAALVLPWAPAALANPADVFGLGSRSFALGGAVSADVSDFSASYYNPAGLALAEGLEISLGAAAASYDLQLDGVKSEVDPVRGLVAGLVAPGRLANIPLAFGIATHIAGRQLSRTRTLTDERPFWPLYESRGRQVYFSANVAVRPMDRLVVGGGVAFLAATRGGFTVQGTAVQPFGEKSVHDSPLRHEVRADLKPVRSPQFGLRAELTRWLSLALVYRGQAQMDLSLRARLEGDVLVFGALPIPAQYTAVSRTAAAFGPRQVVLGLHASESPQLAVNVDLVWVQWSRYRNPISNADASLQVGAGIASLPEPGRTGGVPPAHLADRFVPRLGVESRLGLGSDWSLPVRIGYTYEASPASRSTPDYLVDRDRHTLSAGVGLHAAHSGDWIRGGFGLDLHLFGGLVRGRAHAGRSAHGRLFGMGLLLSAQLR